MLQFRYLRELCALYEAEPNDEAAIYDKLQEVRGCMENAVVVSECPFQWTCSSSSPVALIGTWTGRMTLWFQSGTLRHQSGPCNTTGACADTVQGELIRSS